MWSFPMSHQPLDKPLCMLQGVEAPTRETLMKNAVQAYARAKTGLPDEWVYSCYHGKLQSKLGESRTVKFGPELSNMINGPRIFLHKFI